MLSRSNKKAIILVFLLLWQITGFAQTTATKQAAYQQHEIYGWQVMVANAVAKDKALNQRILKQVDKDLKNIIQVMPAWSVPYLRKTPLWFEKKMPPPFGNNLFFNGSKKGSAKYNIQHLYGGVVAGSTQSYLAVSSIHPWQLLHELTHAYHQFVTKHSYEPILSAYQNSIEKGLHKFGNQYARKNHKEYFSTLTEAYFGVDANFPHNRQQLAEHDPIGYCAIVKAWGIIGEQQGEPPLLCK